MKLLLCYLVILFTGINVRVSADVIQLQLPENEVWIGDIGYRVKATYKTGVGKVEMIEGVVVNLGIDYIVIKKEFRYFDELVTLVTIEIPVDELDTNDKLHKPTEKDRAKTQRKPVRFGATTRSVNEGYVVVDLSGEFTNWTTNKEINEVERIIPWDTSNASGIIRKLLTNYNTEEMQVEVKSNYICEKDIKFVLDTCSKDPNVQDVVFIISSDGGSLIETKNIVGLLTDSIYSERFTFHCVIKEKAWSAAMLIAYSCKNIFIFPGSGGGACVSYSRFNYYQNRNDVANDETKKAVDAKQNAIFAKEFGSIAESNGHNALVPTAMIVMEKELFSWEDDTGKLVISDQVPPEFEYHLPLEDPQRKHYKTWDTKDTVLSLTALEMQELGMAQLIESVADIGTYLGKESWNFLGKKTSDIEYLREKLHKRLQRAFISERDYGERVLRDLCKNVFLVDKMPEYMAIARREHPSKYGGYEISRWYDGWAWREEFTPQAKRLWNSRLEYAISLWENIYQYNRTLQYNVEKLENKWARSVLSKETKSPFQAELRKNRRLLINDIYHVLFGQYAQAKLNVLEVDTTLRQLRSQFK